jgi:protein arginine N-methyltransferase 5
MASELTESIATPHKPSAPSFVGGVYLPNLSTNAVSSLQKSLNDGFDYVVTDLPALGPDAPLRTDVTRLESKWWGTSVVGLVNDPPKWKQSGSTQLTTAGRYPGMELLKELTSTSLSTAASARRKKANEILTGMLEWASHMNIPAVILPPVPLIEFNDDEDEDMFDHTTNHSARENINNNSAKEYARLISSLATSATCTTSHMKLWIRVPFSRLGIRAFQLLLARCDHNSSIGAMLYVDSLMDAKEVPEMVKEMHLFCGGGNVKAVSWDVSIFLRNKKGYPAFSKSHQFMFQLMFSRLGRTLRLLIEGEVGPEGVNVPFSTKVKRQLIGQFGGGSTGRLHYLQYLRHLRSRPQVTAVLDSEEGILETPYLDHLQSPLQPLGDHLEYQTYETFEKDPVKYKNYGDAIAYALEDGIQDGRYKFVGSARTSRGQLKKLVHQSQFGDNGLFDDVDVVVGTDGEIVDLDIFEVTILVVGAGRGPLVNEAIKAVSRVSSSWINEAFSGSERRKALRGNIIAVEKNPSAILYLQSLKSDNVSWNGGEINGSGKDDKVAAPCTSNVTVVGCDMRRAADSVLKYMVENPNLRGDIVVSELLGSFGDNELSPECLDGAQACGILKDNCVSIPQR